MKHKKKRNLLIQTGLLVILFACAASAAFAAEAAPGETLVKLPVSITAEKAFAGAEIAFRESEGLVYKGFEASGEISDSLLQAKPGDKTWIGFYASQNKYAPSDGRLRLGTLVFEYTGDRAEQVIITDVKVHRLTEKNTVESASVKLTTIIPVTRSSGAEAGGSGGKKDENETPGSVTISDPSENTQGEAGRQTTSLLSERDETVPAGGAAVDTQGMIPFVEHEMDDSGSSADGSALIPEGDTPLASGSTMPGSGFAAAGAPSVQSLLTVAAFAILAAFFLFVLFRRKDRAEE